MNAKFLEQLVRENVELMKEKNSDYSGSRGDNITRTGLYGVAVRLADKVERLLNLTDPANGKAPNFESIHDTFRDISNYGLIGQMLEAGQWGPESTWKKEEP